MAGNATAAVRRPAMSSLLQRILSTVMDWFRNWLDRRSSSLPPRPLRRTVALESLEPRLLMSADLIGSVSAAAIPDDVLPGDKFNVSVLVRNVGTATSDYTPVVRLYASNTGQVDAQSIALGESSLNHPDIKAGKSVTVNVTADASRIGDTGNFALFAVVDATNKVRESNENNNVAVAGKPLHVVWSFGSVPGHSNTGSITLTDDFGTRVTFTLTGPGRGDVVRGEDGFDLHLTGTNANSVLKIATSGGRGYTDLGDVAVDGSLKQIEGAKANLLGDLSIGGTVRSIELRDIEDGAAIAIAGTGVPVKLIADAVAGASIHSASAFESISIEEWLPGASGRGVISAPSIDKLTVGGAFGADLDLTGAASGPTLSTVQIDGRITGGLWNVGGSAGQITAKSIEAPWQGSFEGAVQKIRTEQNLSGTLATPSIVTVDVGGSMVGARLLIGASLGSDGVLNRSATPADRFGPGSISELRVNGTVTDSSIFVGVDPVDGVYGNGNDVIVGGTASSIRSIAVSGKLLGLTSFVAGSFPSYVRINGQTIKSSTVPQFHTTPTDTVAPQVSLALANDSGASASDGVTWDPTLSGTVAEYGALASLTAAVDGFSPSRLVNIKPYLQADGSFTLDEALLASILGAPLADGVHTVHVQAIDAAGNATVKSFAFTLDRTVPEFVYFDLAPESDGGIPGDRLTGFPTVAFNGLAAANTAFAVDELGISGVTNPDGTLRIENVALSEGDNPFTVRFTDLAGNQAIYLQTIRLDSSGPSLQVGLAHDTGSNPADGVTSDPAIAGFVGDNGLVTSMSVGIDGGSHSGLLAFPTPGTPFQLSAAFLEQLAGGVLGDGAHTLQFAAYDAAGNATTQEFGFVLDRNPPTPPQFDLALESDTGAAGDQHTTEAVVSLTGLADFEIDLQLNDVAVAPVWAGNVFRIDNVALQAGENILTLVATDLAGNQSEFVRSIFRDEVPVETGLFADLAVTSIQTQVVGQDAFGRDLLEITWTVANQGDAIAQGRHGAWGESVHLSYDDTPWNGDSFLAALKITDSLAPGEVQERSITVALETWFGPGYRVYVVTDDEVGFFNEETFEFESFANEVFEKTAGEFNDLLIQDLDSGVPPPPIAPAAPGPLALDGTAVGGSIGAGQSIVYTFNLGAATRLYFDSLSDAPGLTWTVRPAGDGDALYTRSFDASDAFGIGAANPLLNLAGGNYELVVSNSLGEAADYGFRLLNPDLAAFHHLVLDGGPVLRETLERGDWTDIYQFEANAGTRYVAGGPNDWAIDGALYWRLFDPQGNQIWTATTEPSDEDAFDLTGTYTLMIEGRVGRTDPAMYNAYVFTPQDRDIALITGQRIQGFLDSPGQVNTYHFTLDEPTVAFFDAYLESNGPWFDWVLEGPDGVVDGGNTRQESDQFGNTEFMSLGAGAYTLRIQGQGDAAGWYNFGLFDLVHDAGTPLAVGQPASGVLAPGFGSTLYRFDAVQGQDLEIALHTMDRIAYDAAHWYLVDANGNVVSNGQGNTSAQVTTAETGSYSLLIQGRQYNWINVLYALSVAPAGQQPGVTFDLAPESDTDIPGDRATTESVVTLVGTAAPFAHVSLEFMGLEAIADETGAFAFSNVFLFPGENAFIVRATDSAGNSTVTGGTIFQGMPAISVSFDLAQESDTGSIGDHRTTLDVVSLAGVTLPFATVSLLNTPFTTSADAGGQFQFGGIALALGENAFTVQVADALGNTSAFTRSIFRDEVPVESGFPDLIVSGIRTEVLHTDASGTMLRVSWTTSNEGPATAVGRHGAWAESVHLSYDDIPWNGDRFLGNLKVTSTLAPGASEEHFLDVFVESWFGPGYRIYVVTDDEQGIFDPVTGVYEYFANEVAEKDVGEFNDLAIQDVPSGIPPAPIAPAGPGPLPLDGTAVGGSIGAGGSTVYTFSLADAARLYFDSLSESPGLSWTLRTAGGVEVATRSFAASDAFGFGAANPLLDLLAGGYELEIRNASAQAGDYGFRLLDPDLAAFDNLVLDGGPVSRETLERGNWTDIYQFEAGAGTRYVAGGPNDWAIDGGLFWRLFDPDGIQIWTGTTSPSDEQAFAKTGTYTLLVEGRVGRTDAQQYSAYVFTPQDRDIALITGQRIQGFLDSPGQVNTYHFTLEEATVAFFDGYLESNGPYFSWTLQGPGGIVETGSTRSDTTDLSGGARLLNLAAGEYSLTIEGFDNAAGWYNFGLFDLVHDEGTPLAVGHPALGALVPGFNSTLYRFDGAAGQQLTIDLNTMDPDWISYDPVHWLVVDGTGAIVAQGQAGIPVQATLGEPGSYSLLIQAHQFNWFPVQYAISVTPAGQAPGVVIGLAPESDTGIPGDQRTENSMVNLAGTAAPHAQVTLEFLGMTTTADDTGAFRFENVFLQFGANPFIVHAVDAAGNESVAGARIVMEFPPTFSQVDLVASNVVSQVLDDGFGNLSVLVSWTTTNQGTTFAAGGPGFWNESVYYSMTDDQPFSGDDILIGSISIVSPLDPGFSQNNSALAAAPALTPGGRFYVVVDDGNLVLETPEGELNNITMQA